MCRISNPSSKGGQEGDRIYVILVILVETFQKKRGRRGIGLADEFLSSSSALTGRVNSEKPPCLPDGPGAVRTAAGGFLEI